MKSDNPSLFSDKDMDLKFEKKTLLVIILVVVFALIVAVPMFTGLAGSSSSAQAKYTSDYYQELGYNPSLQKAPIVDFTWIIYPLFFIAGFFFDFRCKKIYCSFKI